MDGEVLRSVKEAERRSQPVKSAHSTYELVAMKSKAVNENGSAECPGLQAQRPAAAGRRRRATRQQPNAKCLLATLLQQQAVSSEQQPGCCLLATTYSAALDLLLPAACCSRYSY